MNGGFIFNGKCTVCDHTICATCSDSPTNCLTFCREGCKVCNPDGNCGECPLGFFLYEEN